jgi:toxin CcdB
MTTTVVAPLFKPDEYKVVEKLTPVLIGNGQRYVAAIDRLASVPKADLGKAVANVESTRLEIFSATDFLLTGY